MLARKCRIAHIKKKKVYGTKKEFLQYIRESVI